MGHNDHETDDRVVHKPFSDDKLVLDFVDGTYFELSSVSNGLACLKVALDTGVNVFVDELTQADLQRIGEFFLFAARHDFEADEGFKRVMEKDD